MRSLCSFFTPVRAGVVEAACSFPLQLPSASYLIECSCRRIASPVCPSRPFLSRPRLCSPLRHIFCAAFCAGGAFNMATKLLRKLAKAKAAGGDATAGDEVPGAGEGGEGSDADGAASAGDNG